MQVGRPKLSLHLFFQWFSFPFLSIPFLFGTFRVSTDLDCGSPGTSRNSRAALMCAKQRSKSGVVIVPCAQSTKI